MTQCSCCSLSYNAKDLFSADLPVPAAPKEEGDVVCVHLDRRWGQDSLSGTRTSIAVFEITELKKETKKESSGNFRVVLVTTELYRLVLQPRSGLLNTLGATMVSQAPNPEEGQDTVTADKKKGV